MVEASRIEIQSTHLLSEQAAQRPDWELYICRIAKGGLKLANAMTYPHILLLVTYCVTISDYCYISCVM